MKHNIKRFFALVLAACMIAGLTPVALVNTSAESVYATSSEPSDNSSTSSGTEISESGTSASDAKKAAPSQENAESAQPDSASDMRDTLTGYFERPDASGILSEDRDISIRIKDQDGQKIFHDTDKVTFAEPDANVKKAVEDALQASFPDGFTTLAGYTISLLDENNQELEPNRKVTVNLLIPKETIVSLEKAELYHTKGDGTYEKLDFKIQEERNLSLAETDSAPSLNRPDSEKSDKISYISFETESFSTFLFVKAREKVSEAQPKNVNAEEPKAEEPVSTEPKTENKTSDTEGETDSQAKNELPKSDDRKDIQATSEKNGLKSSFRIKRAPVATQVENPVEIESLNTTLFAGAQKQSDGTYKWTPSKPDAGHAFNYRISFSTSGEGNLPANAVQITVPKSVYQDRNQKPGDKVLWSIPSSDDIASATDQSGKLNLDLIDSDSYYAYRDDGNEYVIYNFRDVSAAQNNYIEMSYELTETTFNYADMQENVYSCSMTVNHGITNQQKSTTIKSFIDTSAEITSTTVRYPTRGRIEQWEESWGTEAKPADSTQYYYLIFDIESNIRATQPYDFSLSEEELISNEGNHMLVIGHRMSGESVFSKTETEKKNQTINGTRYDQVLIGIPLSVYNGKPNWAVTKYKVTGNVTSVDEKKTSIATGQNSWSWTQPVFHEPGGSFNGYKRGDGAYRNYSSAYFRDSTHYASSRDLHVGKWTRYDLENFNGFSEDGNENQTTLDKYDNFDFGSWIIGYPGSYTADGSKTNPEDYWKKKVNYELTDDGVYLLNSDKALASNNGSSARTIGNGINETVDGKPSAIKLTNDDFRIDKLEYSWYMRDAAIDNETMTFKSEKANYTNDDVITFEGKFNGSDEWEKFATYDIQTGTFNPVDTYVSSMDNETITFKDGQDLTAYRVTTSNAHYYTELFTVPFYSLKNSERVMSLLQGSRMMILVNNNEANFYDSDGNEILDSVCHSDADYATASVKDSKLQKSVVSYANNTRKRQYTITWKIEQEENVTSGETGKKEYIPQQSGIFYDLLPAGSIFDSRSVDANAPYTVQTIKNYQGSGRMMLVVKMTGEADRYYFTFDTIHSWNSIKDYGTAVHNPVAYETGNDSITKGSADNGGTDTVTVDRVLMSDLSRRTGQTKESLSDADGTALQDNRVRKFLFASYDWDISALFSASAGLTKKVKNDTDRQYSKETKTTINDDYTYELRYMNAPGAENKAKNIILFDSLENYGLISKEDDGASSEWHGVLDSIDTAQLTKKGIKPVIYISTKVNLNPETDKDLSDTSIWTKVTDTNDLYKAKAVAIDASKKADGSEFVLEPGDSIVAYLSMRTPDTAPAPKDGEQYPYAYNNVYVSNTLFNSNNESNPANYMIHYDYTRVSLTVSGNLHVKKVSAQNEQPISGITFRLYGTSDYGTAIDERLVSGPDGMIDREKLEKGTYTLQEVDATDDYLLDPTEHKVVIDGQGHCQIDTTDTTASGSPFEITNKVRVHTDVSFRKVNAMFHATVVKGAEYRLSGRSDYGTDVFMTAVSDADGNVVFENIEKGTYSLKEITAPDDYMLDTTEYDIFVDEDANFTITKKAPEDIYNMTITPMTKYSHTENISDDGTKNSNYGNYWNNSNIRGTDRNLANSQAHVVTIPGAKSVHVKITWGGESANYDWVTVWAGSHLDYTAYGNNSTGISGVQKLGGGSHTSTSNTKEFDVDGDTVTFGYRSDSSGCGNDGYGYYAVITGKSIVKGTLKYAKDAPIPVDKENGIYTLADEPLHYFTFTKKSSYDKSVLGGASFTLIGTSDRGTSVNMTAQSGDGTGTVRFSRLEPGTYILKETTAPDGFYADGETPADPTVRNSHVVHMDSEGKYTISGLVQESEGYVLYDTKKADKIVTVKKVWDDGRTDHNPNELGITITNQVPDAAKRNYTIIYDANGGKF